MILRTSPNSGEFTAMIATTTLAKIQHARYLHSPAAFHDMIRLWRAGDTIAEFHAGPIVDYPYFRQRLRRPVSILPRTHRGRRPPLPPRPPRPKHREVRSLRTPRRRRA